MYNELSIMHKTPINQVYLKTAVQAANESSGIFKKFFGKPKDVKIKGNDPRNLVTEIDKKIETQIRQIILKKFSSHKIIGEEFGGQKLSRNDFVWIIDPIDGTTNYIQGLPICCISIGLWQNNSPLVGVVYNPILNQLFTAARGQGAFLNGKRINVSEKKSLKLGFGGFGWGRNIEKAQVNFPKLIPLLHKVRTLGSATMEMCFIALGVYDFHIQNEINVWDFAASAAILKEAGGEVTEIKGGNLTMDSTSFLASNKKLHKQILNEFKKAVII
jgi:myo-inositol-1(or 4)-monophosphatase